MNLSFTYITYLVLLLLVTACDVRSIQCPELPDIALRAILGTTYNARYMRINLPTDENDSNGRGGGPKRASTQDDFNFFMEEASEENLYAGIPAWEVDHIEIAEKQRKKREDRSQLPTKQRNTRQAFLEKITAQTDVFQSRPWECKAEVHWMDLGADYFPRYIRSMKCSKRNCWYGHYTCKPKRFSIKVLKRSNGQCARISQRLKIFILDSVTGEFAQQWEFEEKAVTFCCDCVMDYEL